MPVTAQWVIPYRIIEERLYGKLNTDDLIQHTNMMVAMLTDAQQQSPGKLVYLMMDMTDVDSLPPAYTMMKQAMPVLKLKNRGLMVLVTNSAIFRNVLELTAHVMRFSVQTCATREEGLHILHTRMEEDDRLALA